MKTKRRASNAAVGGFVGVQTETLLINWDYCIRVMKLCNSNLNLQHEVFR